MEAYLNTENEWRSKSDTSREIELDSLSDFIKVIEKEYAPYKISRGNSCNENTELVLFMECDDTDGILLMVNVIKLDYLDVSNILSRCKVIEEL